MTPEDLREEAAREMREGLEAAFEAERREIAGVACGEERARLEEDLEEREREAFERLEELEREDPA